MKKFLIRITVAICACAFLFGGCAQEEIEQTQTQMETDPSQFLETVNDRLSIDAPVYPFADSNPKVYRATSELFTKEQIEAFLAVCGDSLTGLEDINMDYYIGYDGTTEKGGENAIYSYTTSDVLLPAHFFYTTTYNWWSTYMVYGGQEYYDEQPAFSKADMFAEPREFAFSTVADAEKAVRDALAQLGLTDLYLNRTLYVHKEGMEELTKSIEEFNALDLLKPTPTKNDWTDEDEGYLFEFFQTLDGTPIVYLSKSTDALNYLGANIIVHYQKNGITYLAVEYYLNADDCVETPSSIITASEALEYAKQKLGSVLTRQDASITKVSGEYMYVRENGEFLLRPVWVIYSKYADSGYADFVKWDYVFIDAITGEEI